VPEIIAGTAFATISPKRSRLKAQKKLEPSSHIRIKYFLIMKNWQKFLALAFVAALFLLESCHRGYGCPGADL